MERWGRQLAVLLAVLVVVKLASRDDPPPADADLLPSAYATSPATDGYPVFTKLAAVFPLSPAEVQTLGKRLDAAPDEKLDAPFIARSTEALALFGEFSRRSSFADPRFIDPAAAGPGAPVPMLFPLVGGARLASLRARTLLAKGRASDALGLALSVVDAGRVLERRAQIIQSLVGIVLFEIGSKETLAVIRSGKLPRARLLEAASRLSAPSGAAAGLQEALRFEYSVQIHTLDDLSKYDPDGRPNVLRKMLFSAVSKGGWYLYLPNRTKGLFAARFRPVIARAVEPCAKPAVPPFEVLPVGWRPNVIGRLLYDIAIPSFEKLSQRRCRADFGLTQAAVAAAAEAYRLDHRCFPSSLAELTPEYLPAAPVDPFTGEAPLYTPADGAIHSAGKDIDGKPL